MSLFNGNIYYKIKKLINFNFFFNKKVNKPHQSQRYFH
jgi:hypothetical protein